MEEPVRFVQQELRRRADPAKAGPMAAYMKTDMPFYGVQKAGRTEVFRLAKRAFPLESGRAYRDALAALWRLPHREEKYLAIQFARGFDEYVVSANVPMYERMIREGGWWDFVDELAIQVVGRVLQREREQLRARLEKWIDDRDLWIRRSAILSQIRHKKETDERMLLAFCLLCANEKEFFIRKAIGWALREYARTAPDVVRGFLRKHREAFSPLTVREASRHL
jgi:3-methyladenine DNA glycosylase AlkD